MRLKDTLILLANGYSKKEIDALDAEEAEAIKAEAEAKKAEDAKKAEEAKKADEAKKAEASEGAKKLEEVTKQLEEAKKALQEQQKKNASGIDIGKPDEDDTKNYDELLKTIASYM